jgi:site-specific DNA-methyltransferase (adenine-specific)/modification methylase
MQSETLKLPAPYFDDPKAGITIYHGDCREILPLLVAERGKFDLLLTDPPYGIALDTSARWPWLADHDPVQGDDVDFDPSWLVDLNTRTILWGSNHFASRLPDARGWLAWDKATRNGLDLKQAEIEFAWTNCLKRPRCFRHMWSGAYRDSERGTRYHPNQKPIRLMSWCLELIPEAKTVVDPYMGSGPVAKACKDRGLKYVGIELVEKYCAIAVNRLRQEVLFGAEGSAGA